ncbi:UDP-glucoronosyl and UDP-glucosyl transferase [Colletotrichum orchidophilum]|uniref:UDP-glucoronosyl and UDP-glucosyl transferase n=1 Tax=Colletotrichum orchidophilum TaxID=1209926 RepID=A0A1G4BJE2_9PEZI|nr:UDP-glucoronosyl and UDP-glucosyl transferase [Colletotrichum orchidophilum]OHF01562.1 UDP-glucoronosyl and UDP-glucosyl transferase [Colletotrichum orchidophilum]
MRRLRIGHADELVQILLYDNDPVFTIAVADKDLAVELLRDAQNCHVPQTEGADVEKALFDCSEHRFEEYVYVVQSTMKVFTEVNADLVLANNLFTPAITRVALWSPDGLKIILPSSTAVDFPLSVVPDHLVSCGPLVLPTKPLEEADAGLAVRMAKLPTVHTNLGTHTTYEESNARELASALKTLFIAARKIGQELWVLWKLNQ